MSEDGKSGINTNNDQGLGIELELGQEVNNFMIQDFKPEINLDSSREEDKNEIQPFSLFNDQAQTSIFTKTPFRDE